MKKTIILGAVVIVLLAGGAWWYFGNNYQPQPAAPVDANTGTQAPTDNTGAQVQASVTTVENPVRATKVTVTYTDSGFSPSSVTVAQGGTVTFVNQSAGRMWVASGPHPAHTDYNGTTRSQHCPDTAGVAFDECTAVGAGQSYSFTFTKTGTWPYHNHVSADDFGTVVVQ